jgi:protein-L-isoaspartate(D-aspartate) O-methyltransferase
MLPERPDDIGPARRWFAEELRHTAHVRSPAVVEAFATVPREHFTGPGPWRVLSPMRGRDYWTTDDADPPAQQRPAQPVGEPHRSQLGLTSGWFMSARGSAITARSWPRS